MFEVKNFTKSTGVDSVKKCTISLGGCILTLSGERVYINGPPIVIDWGADCQDSSLVFSNKNFTKGESINDL